MLWPWLLLILLILGLIALDLGLFDRRSEEVTAAQALGWSAFWILVPSMLIVLAYPVYEQHWLGIGLHLGAEKAGKQAFLELLTGYLVEKSLSLDNLLAIALVLQYFQVPLPLQHRLLFWGVVSTITMRGICLALGIAFFTQIPWVTYLLGALLILTGLKLLVSSQETLKLERNWGVRFTARFLLTVDTYDGHRFVTRHEGRPAITPLFLALLAILTADLVYAVDSIPAIFAFSQDPFIVVTSNALAVLGMRSLYFALSAILARFQYLKLTLVVVLGLVGIKMALLTHYTIPIGACLIGIVTLLLAGFLASFHISAQETAKWLAPLAYELPELARMTYRQAKKIVVLITGSTIILFGIILLVMPGPGLLVIFFGLVILATEFVWARRWLKNYSQSMQDVAKRAWRLWPWHRPSSPEPPNKQPSSPNETKGSGSRDDS